MEGTNDDTLTQYAKRKILNKQFNEVVDPSFWLGSNKMISV